MYSKVYNGSMKKSLFILMLLITLPAAAKKVVVQYPAEPEYLNSDGSTYTSNDVNYPRVNELEKLIFNSEYREQPLEIRLARLEQRIFGAAQRGDLNARLDRLSSASTILKRNSQAAQGANTATKAKNSLSNLTKLLTGGQLTGYTPPVYYDPYYAQPYYTNTQQPYGANYPIYNNSNFNTSKFTSYPYVPQFSNGTWGQPQKNGRFSDLFSAGTGNEFYYDDGRFSRDLRSVGGGTGVKIIY